MKNSRPSDCSEKNSKKYRFLLLAFCSLSAMSLGAQTSFTGNRDMHVRVDWHTVAEPSYGASFDYAWNNIHVYAKDGKDLPMTVEFEISDDQSGGLFTLLSTPLTVPGSGARIVFDRHVIMHPSADERGTSLPNDPQNKCENQRNGISRAAFHHMIRVVDAETGNVLAPNVNEHKFDISRYQILNDVDDRGEVTIDLSPFAGRTIRLRTIVLVGYNGRGPSWSTTPVVRAVGQPDPPSLF